MGEEWTQKPNCILCNWPGVYLKMSMTKKTTYVLGRYFQIHNPPVVVLHVDVQAQLHNFSPLSSPDKQISVIYKHNSAAPSVPGGPLFPSSALPDRRKPHSLSSISFSLLQVQSLSLSLHVSSLLLYLYLLLVLRYNAEFLFLLAFSLLFSLSLSFICNIS